MQVELRSIDAVRPYEKNPRVNDQAVDALAASLKAFGFRQPIVVDADGIIIVGHTRWKAVSRPRVSLDTQMRDNALERSPTYAQAREAFE